MTNNKITIVGGGIAGVEAAIYCRKEGFDVELICDKNYLFIYPISIWIPVGTLDFNDATIGLDKLASLHGFTVTIDTLTAINPNDKTITLKHTGLRQVPHLIIALGATKVKHPGIEHTLSICGTPEQSLLIKEKIDTLIAKGSGKIAFGFGGNPNDPSAVRGGPGFELFFNLHHRLKKLGIRDQYDMTFFAPMATPGARMGNKALAMMSKLFTSNNFGEHFGKKIKHFNASSVVFEDDTYLDSDLMMFIPALEGFDIIRQSTLECNNAGFIRINDYCEINNVDGWYAIGDASALEGPDWKAKQGHIAEVMARNVAHNHAISMELKAEVKKGYQEHLTILCVMDMGNGAGFVYRDAKKALFIPMPIIGHWMKVAWGWYYKLSKMNYIPRIPGM